MAEQQKQSDEKLPPNETSKTVSGETSRMSGGASAIATAPKIDCPLAKTNGTESCPITEMEKVSLKDESTKNIATGSTVGTGNFLEAFKAFSKFGDTKSDGKHITLSQSDKWMKQAKVIDNKKITTTDTAIHFKKLKALKVSYEDYLKFLEDLANTKKINVDEIKNKMANCGAPGANVHSTPGKAASTVERLTDPKKYTGSHKERFDPNSGKGKGIAGRKDVVDGSGYVSGYKDKNTYDKTH